jgi:dTDP-4-amino-4,6-dideoxygalactose transaminase
MEDLSENKKTKLSMLNLKLQYSFMKSEIDAAIEKCLNHQNWILGDEVYELEQKFSKYLDAKHCIGTSSGTDALVISLRAIAIKYKNKEYFNKNDLIITTPFTFTATGDSILRSGANVVFIDIDPNTYNLDINKVDDFLKTNKKNIIGIIPVHLFGLSCNMDLLTKTAQNNNLFIVEDVAQAFGATWNNKKLGTFGILGAFSFFPSKILGAFGDAGMVSTNDDEIAEIIRMLIKHGGKDKYNIEHIGYNARLDTIQAAILIAKFKYIEELNKKRNIISNIYIEELRGISEIILPLNPFKNNTTHLYHQFTIRVLNNKRNLLQSFLKEKGIDTMVYYPIPLHKMKVFKGRCIIPSSLSISENIVKEVLSLPIEPLMKTEDVYYITDSIREFFNKDYDKR